MNRDHESNGRQRDAAGQFGAKEKADRYAEPRKAAREYVDAIINPSAESAYAKLIDAGVSLKHIADEAVVVALIELLNDPDAMIRLGAASGLLFAHRSNDKAVSVFISMLTENNPSLQYRALALLGVLDRLPEPLKPTLIGLLKDDSRQVRVSAAAVLRERPESFRELRAALIADDPYLVMTAASALVRAGKRVDDAVRVLVHRLKTADSAEVRYGIVCTLSSMKERGKAAGPVLWDLLMGLSKDESDMRRAILFALGSFGLGDAVRTALAEAIRPGQSDSATVCMAALSLKELGEIPDDVIQALVRLLESPDDDDREYAAWTLGEMKSKAAKAIPQLVDLFLKEDDVKRCQLLANIIGSMGLSLASDNPTFNEDAVAALIARAKTERNLGMIRIISAVIAVFDESAIPALIDLARSDDVDSRIAVAAFSHMGEAAALAVTGTLLTDNDAQVREIGATILAEMGPNAGPAIPTLVGLLETADEDILPDVLRALRSLGAEAREAAIPLIGILLGENPFLSGWAASTLLAIGPAASKALRAALAGTGDEGRRRLQAVLDQAGEPSSEPGGIEVIRDEALQIKKQLETFHRVGEICKSRQNDQFTFIEMADAIGRSKSSIQDHFDRVSKFFRYYFTKFEGKVGLLDDEESGENSRKIFDRRKGKKPTICRPLGWRSWELTDRLLRKQD